MTWETELDNDNRILCARSKERYVKYIKKAISRNRIKQKYDNNHHILPRALFKHYSNINANKWNMTLLTPKEHYLIHWLLGKMYQGTMWGGFTKMKTSQDGTPQNGALYEIAVKHAIDSGGLSHNKGRLWVTNGTDNIFLKKNKNIPKGYKPGRVGGGSEKKKWCNNGIDEVYIASNKKIPKGYKPGRLLGVSGPKNMIAIHRKDIKTDKSCYYIDPNIAEEYIEQGWVFGTGSSPMGPKNLIWYCNTKTNISRRCKEGKQPDGFVKGRLPWPWKK